MFVLNPDIYSLPSYRIGPFRTSDIGFNHALPASCDIDDYFHRRFDSRKFFYTINGRSAIDVALEYYKLQANDVVTIFTTTENFYISSCVTKALEKYCKWSRRIEPETRVIFVNHEFGYPYKRLLELRDYGLPIIEDCATTFFSSDNRRLINTVGDFVIFSFPKFFPLQIGGLLLCNVVVEDATVPTLDPDILQYIKNVMSYYIQDTEQLIEKRSKNYELIKASLGAVGLHERFACEQGIVPSVFMFRKGDVKINLPALKNYMWAHGIQCSVFYGEDAFFVPAHQALSELDIQYFEAVITSFIKRSNVEGVGS